MNLVSCLFAILMLCLALPVNALAQTYAPADNATAQLEVRLSAIEEELRDLRGKVEENDFQVKKLSENLDKFQKDTEFRFNDLAKQPAPPAANTASDNNEETAPAETAERHVLPGNPAAKEPGTGSEGVLSLPDNKEENSPAEAKTQFSTPREHYNYAFRLLNQTQYDEAAKAFDAFTKKYPKDPLIGNAYYWEGETYYIRRDYVHAADNFRQGFEALPGGPKAPDNLFKLAMSLDALGRDKEACVVLKQITVKFSKTATNVLDKASQEQKRIGCQ